MNKQIRQLAQRGILTLSFALIGNSFFISQAWAADSAVKEIRGPIWVSVPASGTKLQAIKLTAPANGYVTITATGATNYEHTEGTAGNYCLDLHNVANYVGGCTPDAGSDTAIRSYIPVNFPTTQTGFGTSDPYSIVRTWPVRAGRSYTFYLNGFANNLGKTYLFHPTLTAIYNPKAL